MRPCGRVTRIQDIEGLRAIAALSVLIGHVPWLRVGSERLLGIPLDPWTGVDLFFVISGFVVSRAFERDLERAAGAGLHGAALRAFYLKRAARILPTAYVGLALWWIGMSVGDTSGVSGPPVPSASAVEATASGLLLIWNYTGVLAGVAMPLFWYWSICVEEHFYLLYPISRVAALTPQRRVAMVAGVILLVHAARFATADPRALGELSHLRFDQLGLGVLIGLAHQRWPGRVAAASQRLRRRGWPRVVGLVTLAGLLVALGTLPVTWLEDLTAPLGRVGYVLAGLLAAAVVAIASCDADLLAGGRTGTGRVLSVVGARAYGLYMYHLPALWVVVEIRFRLFDDPQAPWLYGPELIAYVAVLSALVEANYRWIEQPAIRWAARRAMATR